MGDASTDRIAWHADYRDPASPLSRRLNAVRREILAAVGPQPPGGYRIVALWAGQGDDLLGALAGHPRVTGLRIRLVELDPQRHHPETEGGRGRPGLGGRGGRRGRPLEPPPPHRRMFTFITPPGPQVPEPGP